jgi:hypothetical protein
LRLPGPSFTVQPSPFRRCSFVITGLDPVISIVRRKMAGSSPGHDDEECDSGKSRNYGKPQKRRV